MSCTLDLLGDRWTLLVVRDLFRGCSRYSEFLASPEGIATNILADRLGLLSRHGLVEKRVPEGKRRATYRLTDKGRTLEPVLGAVAVWGLRELEGTEARLAPSETEIDP